MMNKKTCIVIGVIVLAFVGIIGLSISQRRSNSSSSSESLRYSDFDRSLIVGLAEKINLDAVNPYSIIAAGPDSGDLPENVYGSVDAPIKIYEYADFQCSHCAEYNSLVNSLVAENPGKVAVVYRDYILSYSKNGVMAAAAAEAAAIQGYWKPFKDLLFANQAEWYYSSHAKFQTQLDTYFETASDGEGNLTKFQQDMASEAVAKKLAFDMKLAEKIGLEGTPTFFVNQEQVKPSDLRQKVQEKLEEL